MTIITHRLKEAVLKCNVYLYALIDSKVCYHNLFMLYVFKFFGRTEAVIGKLQYYLNILVDSRSCQQTPNFFSFLLCHYVALHTKIE